jgi:hypothetical protein
MVIFNSYVKLPEGTQGVVFKVSFNQHMYWTPQTLQAPSLEPRLAQGLLQGLDEEAGGIGLHIHFGLAVPGTIQVIWTSRDLQGG